MYKRFVKYKILNFNNQVLVAGTSSSNQPHPKSKQNQINLIRWRSRYMIIFYMDINFVLEKIFKTHF